jgi:hypothetical protein
MQKKLFVFGGLLGLAIQYMTLLAVLAAAISSCVRTKTSAMVLWGQPA